MAVTSEDTPPFPSTVPTVIRRLASPGSLAYSGSMSASCYLFVYGTLRRRNGKLHPLLRGRARFLDQATIQGRLYDLGRYPAITDADRSGERVKGEVYALAAAEAALRELDRYEEIVAGDAHSEYRREQRTVQLSDGSSLQAWVYLYNRPTTGLTRLRHGNYQRVRRAPSSTRMRPNHV